MELTNKARKGLSQEALKLIACVAMLIDHIGATLVLSYVSTTEATDAMMRVYHCFRMVGRIAFPIFCFLLTEGAYYTKNPKKYALRLAIGAALSEIPFDLVHSGRIDLTCSSVMLTLLLGYGMIRAMRRLRGGWKLLMVVPFYILAEWLGTDYGGKGILLIALLALSRNARYEKLWRLLGFALLLLPGPWFNIGGMQFPVNQWAFLSVIPIFCYGGWKRSYSRSVQWAFYLFYPVHLLCLWGLKVLIFG